MTYHGQVLSRGAEALIVLTVFNGLKAVVKLRIPKGYRDKELDTILRSKRTITEAKILTQAKELGVPVPSVLFTDPQNGVLVIEYIDGKLLKNLLNAVSLDKACSLMQKVGKYVGLMHKNGIIHGDLTTSNMVTVGDEVYIIDFGLSSFSKELESMGVDIHLFLRALESTHYGRHRELFKCFLKGYALVIGQKTYKDVLEKVREIRLRGRYIEERKKRPL